MRALRRGGIVDERFQGGGAGRGVDGAKDRGQAHRSRPDPGEHGVQGLGWWLASMLPIEAADELASFPIGKPLKVDLALWVGRVLEDLRPGNPRFVVPHDVAHEPDENEVYGALQGLSD